MDSDKKDMQEQKLTIDKGDRSNVVNVNEFL